MNTNWKNDGRRFEKTVETICLKYAGERLMRVKKVEQPIRIFQGRTIHLANPFLDYVGTWTERDGRAIFFEAKSTSKARLPIGKGGLSDGQIVSIHQWSVAGAVAFLIWEFSGNCRMWTPKMIDDQSRDLRHLKFENGLAVPAGNGFVLHDFRRVMLECF